MSVLKYWIWLASRRGIGQKSMVRILDTFRSPDKIYFARKPEYESAGLTAGEIDALEDKDLTHAKEVIRSCAEEGIRIVSYSDVDYPERLRNIYDPPIVLYVKGRLPMIDDEAAVAIVGTRNCTPYGVKTADKVAFEFAQAGGLVISGLARGVDTAAAKGALRAGGTVIGVLGCGIDVVYPAENKRLFEDVAAVGAIVSEYPPGTPPAKGFFPARNRIMSGLSVGVAVVEAPEHSGALITAAKALEQGRDVFAAPGNVDAAACAGSNRLLKEGAGVLISGWDLAEEYMSLYPDKLTLERVSGKAEWDEESAEKFAQNEAKSEEKSESAPKKVFDKVSALEYIDLVVSKGEVSADEADILRAIGDETVHIDDIIARAAVAAPKALAAMTMLEIKGIVSQESGKKFKIKLSSK